MRQIIPMAKLTFRIIKNIKSIHMLIESPHVTSYLMALVTLALIVTILKIFAIEMHMHMLNIALLVVVSLNCCRQSLIFMLNNCPVVSNRCYHSALLMTL